MSERKTYVLGEESFLMTSRERLFYGRIYKHATIILRLWAEYDIANKDWEGRAKFNLTAREILESFIQDLVRRGLIDGYTRRSSLHTNLQEALADIEPCRKLLRQLNNINDQDTRERLLTDKLEVHATMILTRWKELAKEADASAKPSWHEREARQSCYLLLRNMLRGLITDCALSQSSITSSPYAFELNPNAFQSRVKPVSERSKKHWSYNKLDD